MSEGITALAIVAATSGTGKTTLMESLISRLKEKGYKVGAVKHSNHEVSLDRKGSDSWRLAAAGSDVTVLASKGQLAVMRSIEEPGPELAVKEASKDTDIVLVEGYKEMDISKIEVFRSGYSEGLYCRTRELIDPFLVAVASDVPLEVDVPVLDLNEPDEVCDFIVERIIKKNVISD